MLPVHFDPDPHSQTDIAAMKYRQLGTDGPEIPVIGLGGWPLGGGMGAMDDRTAIDIVRSAIDEGVTLVDTAQAYRTSEERVGRALKDGYRDRCFLASKFSIMGLTAGFNAGRLHNNRVR